MYNFFRDLQVEIMKRPHPALVHFSLTLFPVSTFFGIMYYNLMEPVYLHSGYWCYLIAAVFMVPIAVTGLLDFARLKHYSAKAHNILKFHLVNGVAATFLAVTSSLLFWFNPPQEKLEWFAGWLSFSILLSLMVLAQGASAALMVYQHKLGIDGETR